MGFVAVSYYKPRASSAASPLAPCSFGPTATWPGAQTLA
jgi:hypothetical protein